jgi:hypothetical protein
MFDSRSVLTQVPFRSWLRVDQVRRLTHSTCLACNLFPSHTVVHSRRLRTGNEPYPPRHGSRGCRGEARRVQDPRPAHCRRLRGYGQSKHSRARTQGPPGVEDPTRSSPRDHLQQRSDHRVERRIRYQHQRARRRLRLDQAECECESESCVCRRDSGRGVRVYCDARSSSCRLPVLVRDGDDGQKSIDLFSFF